MKHFNCIFNLPVDPGISSACDCSSGINLPGSQFSLLKKSLELLISTSDDFSVLTKIDMGAVAPPVVEDLKGFPQRVDLVVAIPAALLAEQFHTLPQGLVRIDGNLRVDIRGKVLKLASEELFQNPDSSVNGIVPVIQRPGSQPRRVGQQPGPLVRWHFEWLFDRPVPPLVLRPSRLREIIGSDVDQV